jgi:hypothetical protein
MVFIEIYNGAAKIGDAEFKTVSDLEFNYFSL